MPHALVKKVNLLSVKKAAPDIRPGYTVKVYQKIKEGAKERLQAFEGLVIKVNSGFGADKTFRLRKIVSGVGVEKIFPLYSPFIEKIEVIKEAKIRRAKLWYMRELSGKGARLHETYFKPDTVFPVDIASTANGLKLKKVKIDAAKVDEVGATAPVVEVEAVVEAIEAPKE